MYMYTWEHNNSLVEGKYMTKFIKLNVNQDLHNIHLENIKDSKILTI